MPHPTEPTDEELDRYVLTRLALVGIDLDVLPRSDPNAPADRLQILESARRFLRVTVPTISAFDLDPQQIPPFLYPQAIPDLHALPPIQEEG